MRRSPRFHFVTLRCRLRDALFPRIWRCAGILLLAGTLASASAQVISTVAGGFNPSAAPSENFCQPFRAAASHATDIYVVSCNRILKIDSRGNQTVVAGNGTFGFAGDGGPATSASFDFVRSIAVDGSGNIFVADAGNRVREVVAATGNIQTVAGNGIRGFSGDGGPATSAQLSNPFGVFVDGSGNIFIADRGNSRIREVVGGPGGNITTVAGSGSFGSLGDGGPAIFANLARPSGVFVDGSGDIFIADTLNDRIREVAASTGVINTVAGNGIRGFSGDGGPATAAMLSEPFDVTEDSSGNLFVADAANARIREVVAVTGNIQTVAGNGLFSPVGCNTSLNSCIGDGGPATSGIIGFAQSSFVDGSGNLFINSFNNILEVAAGTGTLRTFAGNGAVGFAGDNGPATSAQFDYPIDAVADKAGNIFIADMSAGTVREVVAATGIITRVAGSGGSCAVPSEACLGNGGPATNAVISPQAIALDRFGDIFIADSFGEIRKFKVGGIIQSVAGSVALAGGFSGDGGPATSAAVGFPTGVFVDASGNIFIADEFNLRIREVSGGIITTVAGNGALGFSGDGGPATSAGFDDPVSVFVDASGNIFIADDVDHRVREVSGGIIRTVAGNGISGFSGDGGPATSAEFGDGAPAAVFGDTHGNIFVADFFNNSIREFTVGGNIHTVVGNRVEGFSGDGGPAASAELNLPNGVSVDPAGGLLIADSSNARVRLVTFKPTPTMTALISSLNPALVGQAVTFTATVTDTISATPTGTVSFTNNGVPMGTAALNASGVTTIGASFGHAGSHVIIAQYAGNTSFAGSASAPLGQTVNLAPTTTALSSSVNPSLVGQSVTFTATVTSPAAGTLSGAVKFTNNGVLMGTATLNGSGVATITAAFGHAGSHVIIATYSGNAGFAGSALAPSTQTVSPRASTSTTLTSSLNPSLVGQPVTLTATVSSASGIPAGTVSFTNNGVAMGAATLNASGVATITASFGLAATHSIVATYSGNVSFVGSASTTFTQVVSPRAPTSTILTSSVNPSLVGQSVMFTATVTGNGGTPSGMITFTNNGNTIGSASLNGGFATVTVAFGHAGPHLIVAAYAGNASFTGSGARFNQTVNPVPTTTTLSSSINPSAVGQSVTFTATVTDTTSATPIGTMTFTNNGTAMGSATLNANGKAGLTVAFGQTGAHTITATYAGTADIGSSTSATLTQTVNLFQKIAISPFNYSVQVGVNLKLTLTGTYFDGSTKDVTGSSSWSSADPNIVTIDNSGNATGIAIGQTTVQATADSMTTSTTLSVTSLGLLNSAGLYTQIERRGYPSEYWSGQVIQEWNRFDSVVGSTVSQEASLQLDKMNAMGVNTITFELRTSDPTSTGTFVPPDCNLGPALGFQFPQPAQIELANLPLFFDMVESKGMKVWLRLVNTHMEDLTDSQTWLSAILGAVARHPALDLILFEGDAHLEPGPNGTTICGVPAEPPLWLGPSSIPVTYIQWAINFAMSQGLPSRKLSAEAIVGSFFVESQPPAGSNATNGHLWSPIAVEKTILDNLNIPAGQRTYALSFYEHTKCLGAQSLPCTDLDPHDWADQTLQYVTSVTGVGPRIVAPEMGDLPPVDRVNWNTQRAVESLVFLLHKYALQGYGVDGGSFWRWTSFMDSEDSDPTQSQPVKVRGVPFIYNAVQKEIVDMGGFHLAAIPNGLFANATNGTPDNWTVTGSGTVSQIRITPAVPSRGPFAMQMTTGAGLQNSITATSAMIPVSAGTTYTTTSNLSFAWTGDPNPTGTPASRPQVFISILYFQQNGTPSAVHASDTFAYFQGNSTTGYATFPVRYTTPSDAASVSIEFGATRNGLPTQITLDVSNVR